MASVKECTPISLPILFLFALLLSIHAEAQDWAEEDTTDAPELGPERVVFQLEYGDIEFAFFHKVAPKTVHHISKLARMGCYTSNHFFRVDKGFVAQVADVMGGRSARMNRDQKEEAEKTVVGEFSSVKHVRGILSMGRYEDPDSAASSFSMLLGPAPHLDRQYAVFGKVTSGDEVLAALEELPTRKEGIFVMPLQRVTILSTYVYEVQSRVLASVCEGRVNLLRRQLSKAEQEIQDVRRKCLP